jgi:5-methyltetrahydropteroyltriglutamate--homocysteine methyltransferase
MKLSLDRILTTHTGSLPRPAQLLPLLLAQESDEAVDEELFETEVRSAVKAVVQKQVATGIDIVNDGEMSKPSYASYSKDRLTGFGGPNTVTSQMAKRRDHSEFPDFAEIERQRAEARSGRIAFRFASCDGPISYCGHEAVQKDIDYLKAAVEDVKATDIFMSAASPGVIALFCANTYYPDEDAYLEALASAMREEYEAIYRAGIMLQLDCPDLAMPIVGGSMEDYRRDVARRVEVLNYAVANIPAEAIRLHVCWGNREQPRNDDPPLKDLIDILLRAKPAGLMLMGANGRHAHEWKVFEEVKLPEGRYLIPGVIDSTTNVIEHPEAVAERLVRYASVAGRNNVIAGSDCGFATSAGSYTIAPTVAWAKLNSMAEGAMLASKELW